MSVPKHIVAVAGLIADDLGRVLMIRNLRDEWEFPGGQVEEGEDLIEALQREVWEETGVGISVGELVGVYSNVQSCIVMLDFLCKPIGGDLKMSEESLEVEWVNRTEVLSRIKLPVICDRMRDMLEFDGQVVYRAYSFGINATRIVDYTIKEERNISGARGVAGK